MLNAYKEFWINALDFNGRSKRSEYWLAVLVHALVLLLLELFRLYALTNIYLFCIVVPLLAIQVRRLRDSNKSWKWIFIQFLPVIGIFWLMYLNALPGTPIT